MAPWVTCPFVTPEVWDSVCQQLNAGRALRARLGNPAPMLMWMRRPGVASMLRALSGLQAIVSSLPNSRAVEKLHLSISAADGCLRLCEAKASN